MSKKTSDSIVLKFLYNTVIGRLFLKAFSSHTVSSVCGKFMDCKISCVLIKRFIKISNIDMTEYEDKVYKSFNDFFTRKIKKNLRPVCNDKTKLIAPCDGLLSVYTISGDTVMTVKQSRYTVSSLLKSEELARKYTGGTCFVFRLCVNHYHRYCYPDNCVKGKNKYIKGILHTVRPLALEKLAVFTENSREFTILETENFDSVIQMEVGAMLVGKIDNYHNEGRFVRGEEKGKFLYGGSTIILLTKKDTVVPYEKFTNASNVEIEIPVKYGEPIAEKYNFKM